MKGRTGTAGYIKKAVIYILVILSVLASVTKVLTGFDIDEAYALAIPYRVLQGDRLFADMWEVHQTSFLLPYLFMKLFYAVTGSVTGIVLYMRIMTTIVHLAVSVPVYFGIKRVLKNEGQEIAVLLALGYYNFLPKWMISMDFSMQQLWFFTLFAVCFLKAWAVAGKKRNLWLAVAGLMLALDVLAYPGMVLVYPVAVFLILFKKKEGKWTGVFSLTGGCLVAAVIFFLYIFRYMTLQELLQAVPQVFMDGSHQYDLATKLGLYVSQWAEVLVQSAILLVPSGAVAAVAVWFYKRRNLEGKYGKLPTGLLFCAVFEILVSALISFAGAVVTWGPFRLQVRYIIQFVMAFFIWKSVYKARKTENNAKEDAAGRTCLWLLWLSLTAFLGVLIASNVGPVTSSSYLVIGNLVFVALSLLAADKSGPAMRGLTYAGTVLFVLSLIMCKGYYMRNTEYVPGDISEPLAKVESGPLAGICVPVEDQVRYTRDYETIQSGTTNKDRVLFMGTEGLCNLYANGKIVIPTTISTPAFNEQWVDYFTMYPEKQPTVIFLAKNTIDDRNKFFVKNVFGIWIAERYDVECMEETESLCILRLRQ